MIVFVILLTLICIYASPSLPPPPPPPPSPPPSPLAPCTEVWDRIVVDDCGDYNTECYLYVTVQQLGVYGDFGTYIMCGSPSDNGTCIDDGLSPECNTSNFNPPSPPLLPPLSPPLPPIAPSIAFYIFTPIGALLVGIVFAFIVFAVKYKQSEREREILRNARRGQSVDMETTAIIMEQKGPVKKDLKQNLGYGKSRFNKPSRFAKRGHRLP